MEQLVELGVEAIAALEEGVQSNDREVSFRSRHALDIVREHDFQRRLRAFAAGQDAQETYELPGWALFRKEVGDGLEARRLFVEMQQAEPQLLQALARSPDKAVEALVDRLEEIQQAPGPGRSPSPYRWARWPRCCSSPIKIAVNRSDWQCRTSRRSTGRMCSPPRFRPAPSGKS